PAGRQVRYSIFLLPSRVKRKSYSSSYIFLTSNMDRLSVRFNDVFTNRQTKTTSGHIDHAAFLRPIKSLKQSWQVFFIYSDPIVTQFHKDVPAIGPVHTSYNISVGLSVFDRVVQEVYEDLSYFFFVGMNRKRGLATLFNAKTDMSCLCLHRQGFEDFP